MVDGEEMGFYWEDIPIDLQFHLDYCQGLTFRCRDLVWASFQFGLVNMFLLSWAEIVDILALGHADANGFEGFEILVMFFALKLYLLAG